MSPESPMVDSWIVQSPTPRDVGLSCTRIPIPPSTSLETHHNIARFSYPSPPSPCSQFTTEHIHSAYCSGPGELLDSPHICHGVLSHTPLTPPPSNPSSTLPLPPETPSLAIDTSHHCAQSDPQNRGQLLSPISPEWSPITKDDVPVTGDDPNPGHVSQLGLGYGSFEPFPASDGLMRFGGFDPYSATSFTSSLSPDFDSSMDFLSDDLDFLPSFPEFSAPVDRFLADRDSLEPAPQAEPVPRFVPMHDFPCSPSLQSRTLPDLEDEDVSMPYSPMPSAMSLPGASSSPSSSFDSMGTVAPGDISLLFDDSAVLSADEFGDELDFEGCTDPDLGHLLDMRRRARHAERTARQLEDATGSPEARSNRKRAKERCKEIDAMLRLKCPSSQHREEQESVPTSKQPHRPKGSPRWNPAKKVAIQSMYQLVAKMMLRRHERKGSANKCGEICGPKPRSAVGASSPLSRVTGAEDDIEQDEPPPIDELMECSI